MKSASEKWDDGCQKDYVRNSFIVPTLVNLFSGLDVERVLDIGAGTGYIARAVDAKLSRKPNWVLLDYDNERIDLARTLIPVAMQVETFVGDFTTYEYLGESYDVVLILFTLLEMELNLELFTNVSDVLSENGHVIIAIPDSLDDVHKAALNKPSLLSDFLDGNCTLEKVDKFTSEKYPFKAHRFEYIVQLVLYAGFSLKKMFSHKNSGNETFMLVFKKMVK